jgi:hypothetical protein
MNRIVFTIGYVTSNCTLETIYCGDNNQADVLELSFQIIGDTLFGIDNSYEAECTHIDLWDPKSDYYANLAMFIGKYFNFSVSGSLLYDAYSLVNEEPISESLFYRLDIEAPVIDNYGQKLNQKIYYRHYLEEEDEIIEECVIVTKLNVGGSIL